MAKRTHEPGMAGCNPLVSCHAGAQHRAQHYRSYESTVPERGGDTLERRTDQRERRSYQGNGSRDTCEGYRDTCERNGKKTYFEFTELEGHGTAEKSSRDIEGLREVAAPESSALGLISAEKSAPLKRRGHQ